MMMHRRVRSYVGCGQPTVHLANQQGDDPIRRSLKHKRVRSDGAALRRAAPLRETEPDTEPALQKSTAPKRLTKPDGVSVAACPGGGEFAFTGLELAEENIEAALGALGTLTAQHLEEMKAAGAKQIALLQTTAARAAKDFNLAKSLRPLAPRSEACDTKVKLHVLNRTEESLGCRWLDYEGRDNALVVDLPPGQVAILDTYATHAWKVVGLTSGATHVTYVCTHLPTQALNIRVVVKGREEDGETTTPVDEAAAPPKEEEKQVQTNISLCWHCSKRVPLANQAVPCRCGYTFCKRHRLAEDHECPFDYKSLRRLELAEANQRVVADKLPQRVQ